MERINLIFAFPSLFIGIPMFFTGLKIVATNGMGNDTNGWLMALVGLCGLLHFIGFLLQKGKSKQILGCIFGLGLIVHIALVILMVKANK
jgi:hypothetical protein